MNIISTAIVTQFNFRGIFNCNQTIYFISLSGDKEEKKTLMPMSYHSPLVDIIPSIAAARSLQHCFSLNQTYNTSFCFSEECLTVRLSIL